MKKYIIQNNETKEIGVVECSGFIPSDAIKEVPSSISKSDWPYLKMQDGQIIVDEVKKEQALLKKAEANYIKQTLDEKRQFIASFDFSKLDIDEKTNFIIEFLVKNNIEIAHNIIKNK